MSILVHEDSGRMRRRAREVQQSVVVFSGFLFLTIRRLRRMDVPWPAKA